MSAKFKPGDKVIVSYDGAPRYVDGEIIRDMGNGWWVVKQPDGYNEAFIEVGCAEEYMALLGEKPAPTPGERLRSLRRMLNG